MAGIPASQLPAHDGISLLPTLTGLPDQAPHDYLYWEFSEQGGKQAVLMGDWKAVRLDVMENPTAPLELYHLAEDVGEENDVAAQHPEWVARMEEVMRRAHEPSKLFPLPTDSPGQSPTPAAKTGDTEPLRSTLR
jgi:arylsulfatase A-like enzyme